MFKIQHDMSIAEMGQEVENKIISLSHSHFVDYLLVEKKQRLTLSEKLIKQFKSIYNHFRMFKFYFFYCNIWRPDFELNHIFPIILIAHEFLEMILQSQSLDK